jgi:hypothetical protein
MDKQLIDTFIIDEICYHLDQFRKGDYTNYQPTELEKAWIEWGDKICEVQQ